MEKYSDGEIHSLLEENLRVFADESLYQIDTIEDLIEAMENEMSYWEG